MKIVAFVATILNFAVVISSGVNCPLTLPCNSTIISTGFVESFCQEKNASMVGRCCMTGDEKPYAIGLDLRNCGLHELNKTYVMSPTEKVEIIDLQDNDFVFIDKRDFLGYSNLNFLYLPLHLGCPGGYSAWNITYDDLTDNFTACQMQLSPCQYLNISCTINGQCIHKGPGSAKCICLPHQHGYKCLEYGYFPWLDFSLGLTIPSVLLSVALWFYIRRDIYHINLKEEYSESSDFHVERDHRTKTK